MTWLIHRNQHSQHPKKYKKQSETWKRPQKQVNWWMDDNFGAIALFLSPPPFFFIGDSGAEFHAD